MDQLQQRLFDELRRMPTIDIHSHVDAAAPVSRVLREILGYHYFTELAHSAGLEGRRVAPDVPDEEMIPPLVEALERLDNTVQNAWLGELASELFGFDEPLTAENWPALAEKVEAAAARPERAREIMRATALEKVYLTNNFDEDLSGIDREMFVPCLRTDALVTGWGKPETREAFTRVTGEDGASAASLVAGLDALFCRFKAAGAASAAISLGSDFRCRNVGSAEMDGPLAKASQGAPLTEAERETLQVGIFYRIAEMCEAHGMPYQLMIGVIRDAYESGVHQGRDLLVVGGSLSQYLDLFNRFKTVDFPVSILSLTQSQELASYGWIVHNVKVSGHWWYANVPSAIEAELRLRLACVPKTKLIGYYSDMYKLEFGLPKFNMYRRVLARVLAEDYVEPGRLSEAGALALAKRLMHDNAVEIFGGG
jgi:glucuronate isomerase